MHRADRLQLSSSLWGGSGMQERELLMCASVKEMVKLL